MTKDRLSLNDVEWGEFRIKDLFETFIGTNGVQTYTGAYVPRKDLISASTPRITVRETNNGIDSFSDSESKSYKKFRNFISVSFMGSAFYHPYEASLDMKVHALIPKEFNLTKNLSLFIIRCLKNNTEFNSYGNQLSSTDLPKKKILLPLDKNGEPNWQFMEDYIKQEQKTIAQKVINYYEDKIIKTGFDLLGLEDAKWHSFKIKDIFEIKAVKGKTLSSYPEGATPYVSTSGLNNGVSGYVDAKDDISNEKCISIDPIAGKAFYHNYKFVGRGGAGSAINLLYNQNLDENNAQFILTMIEKASREKASYGVALNGERLKNMRLTLPIDEKGEPHWDYMSKFMRKIEQEKLEKALNYIYIYIYI